MLQDGIDYTPTATPTASPTAANQRRFDPSKSQADTLARVFAQSNTIDISKFIALLDGEGVTVSGGEPMLDLGALVATYDRDGSHRGCWTQTGTLGGPGYNKSFTYEVKAPAFSATVKYAKSNNGRNIELLTVVRPGNTSGMVVYGRQIRRDQGDAVLNKCEAILAAGIAKLQREQQAKFDDFITTLDTPPNE